MQNSCDIIIVGGGIIGALAALAIARETNYRIALVDAGSKDVILRDDAIHGDRVSAWTLPSWRYLQSLGIAAILDKQSYSSLQGIQVFDELAAKDACLSFDAKAFSEDALGVVLYNDALKRAIYQLLQGLTSVETHNHFIPETLTTTKDHVAITSTHGITIRGSLLLGADGSRSWVREVSGITTSSESYPMQAIIATVHTSLPHEHKARQIFLKTGPLAFLPLADPHRSSIVWSLKDPLASAHMAMSTEAFNAAFTRAFSHHVGDTVLETTRQIFPLMKQRANSLIAPRVALLGDAAQVVHPLAGQGANLGLQQVRLLVKALSSQTKIGSKKQLRQYERTARAKTFPMLMAIDVVYHTFVTQSISSSLLRPWLFRVLDPLPLWKRCMMAMMLLF